MPPTDPGVSVRRELPWLWILVAVLVAARIVLTVLEQRAPGARAEAMEWTPLAIAETRALEQRKVLVHYFTADWCPPCEVMRREVFSDPRAVRRLEAVAVLVKVLDRQREEGRNDPAVDALQRRFAVRAFPTLVVVDPASGRHQSLEGYPGPEATVAWVAQQATVVRATPRPR